MRGLKYCPFKSIQEAEEETCFQGEEGQGGCMTVKSRSYFLTLNEGMNRGAEIELSGILEEH